LPSPLIPSALTRTLKVGFLQYVHDHWPATTGHDLAEPLARSELRPLRDPTDPDEQEVLVAYGRFVVPLLLLLRHPFFVVAALASR
jgi:hypothetical protein